MPSSKLEAVAYEESDIWTNLLHSCTKRNLLQLHGWGCSFTLRDMSAGDGRHDRAMRTIVPNAVSPLSACRHGHNQFRLAIDSLFMHLICAFANHVVHSHSLRLDHPTMSCITIVIINHQTNVLPPSPPIRSLRTI